MWKQSANLQIQRMLGVGSFLLPLFYNSKSWVPDRFALLLPPPPRVLRAELISK